MATGYLCPIGLILQAFTDQGVVLSGGKIYTYVGGTVSTPVDTYTDSTLVTKNSNPIVLQSNGRLPASCWVPAGTIVKMVLKDSNDNTIPNGTIDNLPAINDLSNLSTKIEFTVTSIANLRTISKIAFQYVFVAGYYSPGDGGGGNYYYDSSDTTSADNGGTIIVATDGGRWKLSYTNGYHVKQFGAKCDGSTVDTSAWQAAFNAVKLRDKIYTSGISVIDAEITPSVGQFSIVGPGEILAKNGTTFEYMLHATSLTGIIISDVTFDSNQANRVGGQNVRFMGAAFSACTECFFVRCIVTNTLGYSGTSAVGLAIGSGCIRCGIIQCIAENCGGTHGTDASDGFFSSGEQNLIAEPTCYNCTDTGAVIETSNNSRIIGGSMRYCGAGAAITNASAVDKIGNIIDGTTITNWSASNTGGIQIGVPTTDAGNLLDTKVSNVTLTAETASYGAGAAINIRQDVSRVHGKAIGVQLTNIQIDGSQNQGVLVDGQNVKLTNVDAKGTTDACVEFIGPSTGEVIGGTYDGGSYGILSINTSSIIVKMNTCKNNGYAISANDTATIEALFTTIQNPTTARYHKDAGATLTVVSQESGKIMLSKTQGSAPSGSLTDKFEVINTAGSPLGEAGLYNA